MKKTIIVLAAIFTSIQMTAGQNIWLKDTASSISLETLKPIFDAGFTVSTSANFLSVKQSFNKQFKFCGIIPFAYEKMDNSEFDAQFAFGNIYLGMEASLGSNSWIETGIHLPTANEDKFEANFVGAFADWSRLESFSIDYIIMPFIFNYAKVQNGFYYRLRTGPKLFLTIGDNGESEVLLDYSGQIGYAGQKFSAIAGVTGSYILTEDLSFDDASLHQIGLGFYYSIGKFVPTVNLRIPADKDINDFLDFTIGLGVTYNFR